MANQVRTILLLGVLSTILIGIGAILGKAWMLGFAALALVLNLGAYFYSDRIVLKMHGARPLSEMEAPRVHAMVAELSTKAGIPAPRLFLIDADEPNAFATGRNPDNAAVAVTKGILRILSDRELRGVIAHELAHVKNRDILVATIAAAIAAAISMIANVLQFTAIFGGVDDDEGPSPIAMIGLALVAPIAATMIQLGVSRSREYLADETGAALCADPDALASALLKLQSASRGNELTSGQPATASLYIVNPLSGVEGITALFSTHPPIRERVRRLHVLAGYPEIRAA